MRNCLVKPNYQTVLWHDLAARLSYLWQSSCVCNFHYSLDVPPLGRALAERSIILLEDETNFHRHDDHS